MMRRIVTMVCLAVLLALGFSSCVHEWPEPPAMRGARLVVRHELPWRLFDFYYNTRDGSGAEAPSVWNGVAVRYIYEVYPAGTTEVPVARYTEVRSDVTLADFTTRIDLPAGEYDVYVWSDFIDSSTERSLFYDADIFSSIKLLTPYRGDSELKDAFQGMFHASVPSSVDELVDVEFDVTLKRPLTAYAFLSTDLAEFIEQETRRKSAERSDVSQAPAIDFNSYKAVLRYPVFLPVEYSIFRNRPIDSATGVSFSGAMQIINSDEVLVGFDYFFINGAESSVNVAIDIYDPEGKLVSSVPSLTIPVERGRATIVRGEFLTSQAHGGIGINPGFDGDFNIEIK